MSTLDHKATLERTYKMQEMGISKSLSKIQVRPRPLKLDIEIENHYDSKIYSSGSILQGRLIISPCVDQHVSALTISLVGETTSHLIGRSIRSVAIHRFLKLDMLTPEIPELISEPLKRGHVYTVPFQFVIPEQLLPTACTHDVDSAKVREHHSCLPPTLGGWRENDMGPGSIQIEYAINACVTSSASMRPRSFRDLAVKKTVKIVAKSIESPPIHVSAASQRYMLGATKTLRQSLFWRSLGTISATAMQPEPLYIHPYSKVIAPSHIDVGLNFDPAKSGIIPPQPDAISLSIRSRTWFNVDPMSGFPDLDDRPSLQTPFCVTLPVSAQSPEEMRCTDDSPECLTLYPSFVAMPARKPSRAMTFTGCWTCKARKVRCDERPNCCRNCEKRGIPCGGYGIRLQWVSDPFAEARECSPLQGRRSMKLDQTSHVHESEKIDEFLSLIDQNAEHKLPASHGPFSAFSVLKNIPLQLTIPTRPGSLPSTTVSTELEPPGNTEWQHESTTDEITSQLFQPADPGSAFDAGFLPFEPTHPLSPFFTEFESIPVDTSLVTELPSVEGLSGEYSLDRPSVDENDDQDTSFTDLTVTLFERNSPVTQIIDASLFRDPEIDSLMSHYNIHVAGLLVPVDHSENPYRRLYLSTAIEAFHRWNCDQRQIRYREIGAKYRYQAMQSLQNAVNEGAPVASYQVLMITILSLVSIGVLSGEGDDFRAHIEAASQLRNSRSRWKLLSRPSKQLNEIGAFLALLSRTTSFQPSPVPWTGRNDRVIVAEDMIIQASGCYEHVYGITPTIAAAINQTCRLAAHLARLCQDQEDHIPDDILEACEEVGDNLQSWRFEHENITSIPSSDSLGMLILNHQAKAWHAAALIYYCTRIQGTEPIDLVQETDLVMEHLRAAEDVKSSPGTMHSRESLAPITWPAFVASCIALNDRRDVWREWWEQMMSYNIGNINKQWEIVQQIWETLDQAEQHGNDMDWTKAYESVGRHVLPT
ncbi:hypothetical protein FSARC_14246 [Fusarium sarcochroum]|uniref:Zn(2)-C6 fungal-type domain-containing protein n=1 Tax=Fusarium sarcochroum TaxID=1208366 RepID=A0A8H4WPP9_9HYPO|nr:hypothetical protein FSARC_14246 [Fusarium sarcochroum]